MVIYKTGYPSLGDPDFRESLAGRKDYQLFKSQPYPELTREEFERISQEQCSGFEKTMYQHLMQHYLSIRSPYRSLLLYHGLGTGKCHARDTPILMYDGTIKMVQDVQVGDLLMGDDSTPRRVLSLASGYDEMYDIVPVKGDKYTVNSEHILCLKQSPDSAVTEIEVKDYIQSGRQDLKGYRVGVEFPERPMPMDPYLFGLSLGGSGARDPIPHIFLANSRTNRLKLLAGLIDAVGRCSKEGYEITTKSQDLSQGILYLARSLGFAAYGQDVVSISGRISEIPVRLPHGAIGSAEDVLVAAIDVQHVGRGKYYGFTLDGNNRYLLGDFTVTHNTCSSITIAEALLKGHRATDEPSIYVVSAETLHKSYEAQIFNLSHKSSLEELREQCAGDHYLRLIGRTELPKTQKERDSLEREVHDMIKKRYKFVTYNKFANQLMKLEKEGKLDTFRDKVIIIDEAHKLRDVNKKEQQNKALTKPLINLLRTAKNNRLILLSATPMYNEPNEILWLLSLLCINDKRNLLDPEQKLPELFDGDELVPDMRKMIEQLASEYVSYIRGNSPFTFPLRVSPEELGIPVLKQSVTDKEVKDPYWPTYYKDGLVPTPLGSIQQEALQSTRGFGGLDPTIMKTHEQKENIVFHGKTGEAWIDEMFEKSKDFFPLRYRDRVPWLAPRTERLGAIACKVLRICEFIKNSTGIVVIYSSYNWSGIVPIALALEHVGFDRYGGSKLLHSVPTSSEDPKIDPYRFEEIKTPRYAIITGDDRINRGAKKSITELLNAINDPGNKDGKQVKVVLITPVASEGLTIKNTREIHILNPWFNINNLEQVIGRTIRTCSHILKPVEERNVTVYLHTTVAKNTEGNQIDTANLHSYRITSRKLAQMNRVVRILRDHAWDCSLMKNTNYIPENRFLFTIQLRSSQGNVFQHPYGDRPEEEPQCSEVSIAKTGAIRPDMYMDVIPTIQTRLRKYVVSQLRGREGESHVIVPMADLPTILRMQDFPEVVHSTVRASLEKGGLLSGYHVFIHKDQLYITRYDQSKKGSQVGIRIEEVVRQVPVEDQLQVFDKIMGMDDNKATMHIYDTLIDDTWTKMAYKIIGTPPTQRSNWLNRVADLLYREGALVHHSEYPSLKTKQDYVGYYDFFQKTTRLYILGANEKLREASDIEARAIQAKRTVRAPPKGGDVPTDYAGIYIPYRGPKDNNTRFLFKVFKKGIQVRSTNPGTACDSLTIDQLEDLWASLKIRQKRPITKKEICQSVSRVMLEKEKVFLPPLYKPIMKK